MLNAPCQHQTEFHTVDIYFNLHLRKWSIKTRCDIGEGDDKISAGRVIAHKRTISVPFDARFVVQKAGHARALLEGQKNVHAFVRTDYAVADVPVESYMESPDHGYLQATYRPDIGPFFHLRHDPRRALITARCAVLSAKPGEKPGLYVIPF